MLRFTLRGLLTTTVLAVWPVSAAAQAGGAVEAWEGIVSREDSVLLLRAGRSDQASFERLRRNRLPETWGGGSSRCDERIGRFCLTHTSGRDDWVPPPEHEQVVAARAQLVDGLGQAAQLIPGDGWIAGQRVRYLVESRRFDEAREAARECRAEAWWCAALAGFAQHYSAMPAAADSSFAEALAGMDDKERERWTDLSLILDDRLIGNYRRMSREEKDRFEARFWRLADPLLTQPGNELRSEHLARNVWDQMQFRAQSADGISWGYDLREILIRYGWPTGWERTRDWGLATGPPPLISHYSSAPHELLPPPETLLDGGGTGGTWEADVPFSRTGYSIPQVDTVAQWFSPLAHQVAVFRRGDEAILVAAYELPADSLPEGARVRAGLAALPTEDSEAEPDIAVEDDAGTTGALMLTVAARPSVLSLELSVPQARRLAHAHHGLNLAPVTPGLLSLSDLLLLNEREALPDSLEGALEAARGSSRVAPEEQIGVYWEIYGLDSEETPQVAVSLRMLEGRSGWLRRLAERAGLLREVAPVRLRWEEPVVPGSYMGRSLHIQIPNIAPGTYTLELTVEAPGREALSVRKDIEVGGG